MDRSALDALASSMVSRGTPEREQALRELRSRGNSPVETIYVMSRVFGTFLSEAKAAIYESSAWSDQHVGWQRLHSDLSHNPGNCPFEAV
ncbi:hypothetical protein SAMN05192584_101503 [Streptomyces pini]|uniref:Uncharacterized protein n=2 Tax=Streptomyces pini TaxID=1520580 RepID=A0A1I3UIE6_9ACTN|nr:hypothetical protein SAMN05192584_101503 [Streptomyces pini]